MSRIYILIILQFMSNINAYVICPYCDPNHVAYPNLEEAMRGYDVPMGNPNPGRGDSDPGIRNQIFVPMIQNENGHMMLDERFITANTQIKCDATWTSEVYDNFNEYTDGKVKSSTMGFGIEVKPMIESMNIKGKNVDSEIKFPPMFSRSWSTSDDVERLKDFFTNEKGSIAVSQAVCITHKIDIADRSTKYFVEPFIDSIIALDAMNNESESKKRHELKRFINEFGTHYASTTEMGTKLYIERRYSSKERKLADDDELKSCNTLAGSKVFGFQLENNYLNCTKDKLKSNKLKSKDVERMIISTFGSFISNSLASWSQQVIKMVQSNSFNPRSIKRELRSILSLLEEKNFINVTNENGDRINTTKILEWTLPMMLDYCSVFEMDCKETGCGIDDDCTRLQTCIDLEKDEHDSTENDKRYHCIDNNSERDNHATKTEKHMENIPHNVTRYYPSGAKEYFGSFKDGVKVGNGTLFYENGNIAYKGEFIKDMMNGDGIMFYENTGNPMFIGTFKNDKYYKGILYKEDGSILTKLEMDKNHRDGSKKSSSYEEYHSHESRLNSESKLSSRIDSTEQNSEKSEDLNSDSASSSFNFNKSKHLIRDSSKNSSEED